jgi:uncharacterized protein YecE (DUF72 family)
MCIADSPKYRAPLETTASWGYFRLHGGEEEVSYGEEGLAEWARRIASFAANADPIYVFFDNDTGGNAVRDALSLTQKVRALGIPVVPPPVV